MLYVLCNCFPSCFFFWQMFLSVFSKLLISSNFLLSSAFGDLVVLYLDYLVHLQDVDFSMQFVPPVSIYFTVSIFFWCQWLLVRTHSWNLFCILFVVWSLHLMSMAVIDLIVVVAAARRSMWYQQQYCFQVIPAIFAVTAVMCNCCASCRGVLYAVVFRQCAVHDISIIAENIHSVTFTKIPSFF